MILSLNRTINNCLISFLTIGFLSCQTNSRNNLDTSKRAEDSIKQNPIQLDTIENELMDKDYELYYIVSIAEGYKYYQLRKTAVEASTFLKLKFDTVNRYYNVDKRKIVLPANYEDKIWAGEYYFRRDETNFVSIEMSNAYIDTLTNLNEIEKSKFLSDSLRMFVFASMYKNKTQADSLLSLILPHYKTAKLIPSQIFMGCMH